MSEIKKLLTDVKNNPNKHKASYNGKVYFSHQEAFFSIILDELKFSYEYLPSGELSFPDFIIHGISTEYTGVMVEIKAVTNYGDLIMKPNQIEVYNSILKSNTEYDKYWIAGIKNPNAIKSHVALHGYLNDFKGCDRLYKKYEDLEGNLRVQEKHGQEVIKALITDYEMQNGELDMSFYMSMFRKIRNIHGLR